MSLNMSMSNDFFTLLCSWGTRAKGSFRAVKRKYFPLALEHFNTFIHFTGLSNFLHKHPTFLYSYFRNTRYHMGKKENSLKKNTDSTQRS